MDRYIPSWSFEVRDRFKSMKNIMFILYGNIRDKVITKDEGKVYVFDSILEFIGNILLGNRDIVLFYDLSTGIFTLDKASDRALKEYINKVLRPEDISRLSNDPKMVFDVLENFLYEELNKKKSIGIIIDYINTLIPNTGFSMSQIEKYCYVTLDRWSRNPFFLEKDVIFFLLTERISAINQDFLRNPYTYEIEILPPNYEERKMFLEFFFEKEKKRISSELSLKALAELTSGMNIVSIDIMLSHAIAKGSSISRDYITEEKKRLIESECFGLLEFIESPYNLDMVAGFSEAKKILRGASKAIKEGRLDVLPMGYLISGPVGTGKSFLALCFAGEVGIPVVKFLNFRSMWQGVTESNLEKILNILKVMAPVVVMIDEADAFLGTRHQTGDSGVSNRVFAQIASFMGDTRYRGKVIWFLITARPDLLPVDLKRQGRAEEHISLFYPESVEEKEELLWAMAKKNNVKVGFKSFKEIVNLEEMNLSGASMESLLIRAKFLAISKGVEEVSKEIFIEAYEDFIPTEYPLEIELQELVALKECTRKSLIPLRLKSLDPEFVDKRIYELKSIFDVR